MLSSAISYTSSKEKGMKDRVGAGGLGGPWGRIIGTQWDRQKLKGKQKDKGF